MFGSPAWIRNHKLDRILKSHKLLILKSRWSRQRYQKHVSGTKSVQGAIQRRTAAFTL